MCEMMINLNGKEAKIILPVGLTSSELRIMKETFEDMIDEEISKAKNE